MTDQGNPDHSEAVAKRVGHRIGYWAKRITMGIWGPAQLPEPVDPVENMKKEHEVQEAVDAAEIEVAAEDAAPAEVEIVREPKQPPTS